MARQTILSPRRGLTISNVASGATYTLGKQLGEGGFGVTFLCEGQRGKKLVAKAFKPAGTKPSVRAAWNKEVQAMQLFNSRFIIRLHDAFEYGNLFYLIMERADGSVREYVQRYGALSDAEVIDAGIQMIRGLTQLHSIAVVHRDLHIDNILYTITAARTYFKISDFGICKIFDVTDDEPRLAFTQIGREFDIAPELDREGFTSYQSDIYQLGLALYFLLTGTPALGPEDGNARAVIASGIARERAEALGTPLGDCIAVMLRRRQQFRFHSVDDAWEALRSCIPS